MFDNRLYLGGDRGKSSDARVSRTAMQAGKVRALMGRNCLIVGPAGSGKLSLVYWLLTTMNPRARQFLFDFELEESAQPNVVAALRARQEYNERGESRDCWILRYVDRISESLLSTVLRICLSAGQGTDSEPECGAPIIYATAEDTASILRNKWATRLFPLRLTTTGIRTDRHTLERVAHETLDDLNERHGRQIQGIDPSAIDFLLSGSWSGDLLELRSIMERAYIMAPEGCLTASSFSAVSWSNPHVTSSHDTIRTRRTLSHETEQVGALE